MGDGGGPGVFTLRDDKLLWLSLSDMSKKGCRLGGAVTD